MTWWMQWIPPFHFSFNFLFFLTLSKQELSFNPYKIKIRIKILLEANANTNIKKYESVNMHEEYIKKHKKINKKTINNK